jgi:hypothetical protein
MENKGTAKTSRNIPHSNNNDDTNLLLDNHMLHKRTQKNLTKNWQRICEKKKQGKSSQRTNVLPNKTLSQHAKH